ncbi:MAG TPA: pitrilysin family protein [Blastocatellia bacterium]|nr:pitrilysin family protein [Blastocatellia bacterium]
MSSDPGVCKTRLDNGLVVVTEQMPSVRSVSFGVFLRTGSRHETAQANGISHFIEHALFKGTRKRSAAQIAEESDTLGGHLDAFTGKEIVGFHNKVLDEHLPRAFELIADLVTAPAFEAAELEKEHNVILEEIRMVEDTPDDLVFEIFSEKFYPDHALGRPILGTPRTLATFRGQRVQDYYDSLYRPDNFVIAAAGNLTHEQLLELTNEHFGHLRPGCTAPASSEPQPQPHITVRRKKDLEQAHLVIGAPCPSLLSDDRYGVYLMNTILGGGMSSRLFQSVREDRGLVYTIYSAANPYKDCGYLTIYAGASNENLRATIDATLIEVRRLRDELVSAEELQRNKDQVRAGLMLNLESTSARMSSLAQQEITFGEFVSQDEVIAQIEAVTAEDIQRLTSEIFRPDSLAVMLLGNIGNLKVERHQLQC